MNFLVDAQLPARLIARLAAAGHQGTHTRDLPRGNRTTDESVAMTADREGCVLVTKDGDFVTSHLLRNTPRKLLLVTTGNMPNDKLFSLFDRNLPALVSALHEHDFVELSAEHVTIHR